MSITASTCITFTGYEPLGNTLTLYSNIDNFTSSFGSVPTSVITGSSCPYIMSGIPDGTTSIQFRDPISLCCGTIFLQNNNLCINCNLSFDVYESETIGQLIVGNLIGDCDDNISDYIINWYRTGSSEVILTTGYGTAFSNIGWQLTHPLTGSSSPILEPGTYYPIINRVIINGTSYSFTGANGTVQANLDCFQNQKIQVSAIQCSDGNNIGNYLNFYQFNNYSVGATPISLSTNFELSDTTNYIAWQFQGFQVSDTFKMVFYGSAYNNIPITIENVSIGLGLNEGDVRPTTNPKKIVFESPIKKVTCLTGFTINNGDYVKISVTPNPNNNNTLWNLYFTCLDSFDCSTCFDQYQNSTPKIDLSSISSIETDCNTAIITVGLSGCSYTDFAETDFGIYLSGGYPNSVFELPSILNGGYMWFNNFWCPNQIYLNVNTICGPVGQYYSFNKSVVNGQGLITFSFSALTDLQYYYSSYLNLINYLNIGSSTNNSEYGFYRSFDLLVPIPQDINETCGDTTPSATYTIHHTSVVTTGGTGPYTLQITMPTIVKGLFPTSCQNYCEPFIDDIVSSVNGSSPTLFNNLTFETNTGSKFQNPFRRGKFTNLVNNSNIVQQTTARFSNWQFQNETYAYSGTNNTLITSLTGKTCEYRGAYYPFWTQYPNGGYSYDQQLGWWYITLTNSGNVTDFKVTIHPVTNWVVDTEQIITALTYTNGLITYSNPDYTF